MILCLNLCYCHQRCLEVKYGTREKAAIYIRMYARHTWTD